MNRLSTLLVLASTLTSFAAAPVLTGSVYVANGRIFIPVADGNYIVQRRADATAEWTTVEGFTYGNNMLWGPDQTLSGISLWRIGSNTESPEWTDIGYVNARSPLFGTPLARGAYNDNCTADKAFDANPYTYYEPGSERWVGLDLGEEKTIYGLGYMPRSGIWGQGNNNRLKNAVFEYASDANFSDAQVFYQLGSEDIGFSLHTVSLTEPVTARYVRVRTDSTVWLNIAELEFDSQKDTMAHLTVTCEDLSTIYPTLTFSANFSGDYGICVYRAKAGKSFTRVATLEAGVTSWTDETVVLGQEYLYRLAQRTETGDPAALDIEIVSYTPARRLERDPADESQLKDCSLVFLNASKQPNPASNAFDGNTGTFPDIYGGGNNPAIGVDFGADTAYAIEKCRIWPRPDIISRLIGVVVYGSNDPEDVVGSRVALSDPTPSTLSSGWFEIDCDSSATYRYVFLMRPDGDWYGNIAEIQFYGWGLDELTKPIEGMVLLLF